MARAGWVRRRGRGLDEGRPCDLCRQEGERLNEGLFEENGKPRKRRIQLGWLLSQPLLDIKWKAVGCSEMVASVWSLLKGRGLDDMRTPSLISARSTL